MRSLSVRSPVVSGAARITLRVPLRLSVLTRDAAKPQSGKIDVDLLQKSLDETPMEQQTTQATHGLNYHHPNAEGGYPFFMPPLSFLGEGALAQAGKEIQKLGFKSCLIVTDGVLHKIGATSFVTDLLDSIGIKYCVFDKVEPNPTVKQVEEGVRVFKDCGSDFILSFGGGSPHDCAKAIGMVVANGGSIRDYEGLDRSTKPMVPLVAVNTTAGTASEMTRFTIITDEDRKVKMAIVDSKCTPIIAVNDSIPMMGMPKGLTAATGMDALTHAIEAYLSTASTPITDACALQAIRLITAYLRDAVNEGKTNKKAREMMAYAEFLAGMAFNSASLGMVHACAHQLGGFYNLPHGVCNAVLLPVVAEFNSSAVEGLFVDIAVAMGLKGKAAEDPKEAVQAVLREIRQLSKDVGIPKNLQELGVKKEDFKILAENALKDACGITNPRKASFEDVVQIFEKAHSQQ